jgi:hypothetical protein
MKTATLRTLQHPTRIATLLDSLVRARQWVPPGAPKLGRRGELSEHLLRLAINAVRLDGAWQAWMCYDGVRLFVAEMSLELSRERGCPALKVSYFNGEAELQNYSHWIQLADGTWQQCGY